MKALKKNEEEKDVRNRLLKVIAQLVAEKGFAATSTREISKRAQCNVSLISYYFGSKEGLYKAALNHYVQAMRSKSLSFNESTQGDTLTAKNFELLIREIINHAFELHKTFPEMQIVLFKEFSAGMPFTSELFKQHILPSIDELVSVIDLAQKQKILREEINPRAFVTSLFQLIDAYFMTQHCGKNFAEAILKEYQQEEVFKSHLLHLLLRGALKNP